MNRFNGITEPTPRGHWFCSKHTAAVALALLACCSPLLLRMTILAETVDPQPVAHTEPDSAMTDMTGTWFYHSAGDKEQMSIYDDGYVFIHYANGSTEETRLDSGTMEYDGARVELVLLDDKTLFQTGKSIAKQWQRIDSQPRAELLHSLTAAAAHPQGAIQSGQECSY
jgi:hypothetical protein